MKLINIRKIYKNKNNTVEALKGINLSFDNAGIHVILGSSGCGKTTLLNIMSGKDKNFEGEIIHNNRIGYLTQEIHLFESMSIYENLCVVKNDPSLIIDYLKRFDLFEHKDKKVRKCSLGQKKRIQFIRILLQKPQLILCDEPTAALDYFNANYLIEELKLISKEIPVVIVTHDISLAENYADRMIRMGKGIVESDSYVNEMVNPHSHNESFKKSWKETLQFVLLDLKSRILENVLYVAMISFCMITLFASLNLYTTIENQTNEKNIFKNSKNIIYSTPKSNEKHIDFLDKEYIEFDYYFYEDIHEIVNSYDEIIAVEMFYDNDIYQTSSNIDISFLFNAQSNVFKEFKYNSFNDSDEINFFLNDYPFDKAFFISDSLKEDMALYREQVKNKKSHDDVISIPFEELNENYGFSFYDLTNSYELPLLVGEMPSNNDQVVISLNTADLLLSMHRLNDYEDLIGKRISVGVESRSNYVADGFNDYYFDDDNANVREIIELEISAISTIENDLNYLVFFNGELGKNVILSHFVDNYDDLYFDYVNFIIEPNANVEEMLEKINYSFMNDKSHFVLNESYSIESSYRELKNFLFFFVTIICILFILIFVYYFFIRNRLKKHQFLQKEYYYNFKFVKSLRLIILHLLAFIFVFIFNTSICDQLNQFAKIFHYETLMSLNISHLFIACLFMFVFNFICEKVVGE